jgi:hypothetical protein
MSTTETMDLVRREVMASPGWITAGTMRYRLPKGARIAPALKQLAKEGIIREVLSAWWSKEPVYERVA